MPRGVRNELSSADVKVGQEQTLDMPVSGSLDNLIRTDHKVEIVDGPALGDYAAELAFNEEMIDVVVHESTDKNAELIVDLYCNGVPQRFIRGQTQKVRRKYVEILANARQTSIATRTSAQGADGEVVNRISKHTAVRYPFSVVYDPNPKGAAWLKKLLQSA